MKSLMHSISTLSLIVGFMVGISPAAAPKAREGKAPVDPHKYTFKWGKENPGELYEETDEDLLSRALQNELADVEEIVFAVRANGRDWHWYANFGYNIRKPNSFYYGGRGAKLCALNLRTGKVRTILEDAKGDIRDPAVHYDGKTILFAYRPDETNQFHLYTIQSDGSGLTQLTDSDRYDDFEPTWTPDGGIVFNSSRCMRWVPCWYAQVANMHRCEADGSDIRPLSFGVETENSPWVLNDGRVIYTRWEYVDRSQVALHGLWTFNPDGAMVQLFYDNLGTGNLYITAKPVPDSDKVVCTVQHGHGRNEGRGRLLMIDASHGPESEKSARFVDRGFRKVGDYKAGDEQAWRDPFPLSENCILTASLRSLVLMNGRGDYQVVYTLDDTIDGNLNLHEPRPLVARDREPIIPPVVDPGDGMGTMVLMDVYETRDGKGIERGSIRSLLIMEELPRPAANCAYSDALSTNSNYVLHRILGTVPIAEDGSAHFKVPAGRPIFFVAQDEKGKAAKAMGSFTSVMPGEVVGCVGCHEQRTRTMGVGSAKMVQAMRREPDAIQPVPDVPEIFDYVRDIQPIWDKHCVSCHNMEKFAGNMSLEGDLTPGYSLSYAFVKRPKWAGGLAHKGGNSGPYATGTGDSKLIDVLMDGHKEVQLSEAEMRKIMYWIDSGTFFAGTYAALGTATRDLKIKAPQPVRDIAAKRCGSCHRSSKKSAFFEGEIRNSGYDFNVSRPDKSILLLAPLSKEAGGLGWCSDKKKAKMADFQFTSKDDPEFQALREFVHQMAREYGEPHYFQPGYKPTYWYIREMKRFGALPEDFDPTRQELDGYEVDRRYFQNIYRKGPGPKP